MASTPSIDFYIVSPVALVANHQPVLTDAVSQNVVLMRGCPTNGTGVTRNTSEEEWPVVVPKAGG